MMLIASQSMMRCLPACPAGHIIAEGSIICEATSFARQGKHHSANRKGLLSQSFSIGGEGGIRLFCGKAGTALTPHRGLIHSRPVRIPYLLPQKKAPARGALSVAEKEGFEPSNPFTGYTISNRAPSTKLTNPYAIRLPGILASCR